MKLDFSVLDAPARASDKLESEWCAQRDPHPTPSARSFASPRGQI